jgi:hypothetical protein
MLATLSNLRSSNVDKNDLAILIALVLGCTSIVVTVVLSAAAH